MVVLSGVNVLITIQWVKTCQQGVGGEPKSWKLFFSFKGGWSEPSSRASRFFGARCRPRSSLWRLFRWTINSYLSHIRQPCFTASSLSSLSSERLTSTSIWKNVRVIKFKGEKVLSRHPPEVIRLSLNNDGFYWRWRWCFQPPTDAYTFSCLT